MKKLPAFFFQLKSGREPVREFLLEQSKEDRYVVGCDIKTIEQGWPIGMPICRPLGHGLWEVRSTLSSNRIARILFTIHNEKMCLLHVFIKKTQTTPKADIDLARERISQLQQRSVQ